MVKKEEENKGFVELIATPHAHDVLCGRGGLTNQHAGNEWYRRLVRSNRALYRSCPKHTKLLVSKAIVQAVQQQDPPGRFLEIHRPGGKTTGTNTGGREPLMWKEITYKRSVDKTSQALREREPPNANGGADSVDATASKSQQLQQQEQYLSDLTKITLEAAGLSTPASKSAPKKPPPPDHAPEGILTEGTSDDSVDGSRAHSFPISDFTVMSNVSNDSRKRKAKSYKDFVKPSWWSRGAPPKKFKWESAQAAPGAEEQEAEMNINPLPLPPQPLQARQSSMFRFLSQTGIFGSGNPSNAVRKPAPAPSRTMQTMKVTKASLLDDDDDETTAVANLMKMKVPSSPQSALNPSQFSIQDEATKTYEISRRQAAGPTHLQPAALMVASQQNSSQTRNFMQEQAVNSLPSGIVAGDFKTSVGGAGNQSKNSQLFGNHNVSFGTQMNVQNSGSNKLSSNTATFDIQQQNEQALGSSMSSSAGSSPQSYSNVNSGMGMGLLPDASSLSPQDQIKLLQKQIEMQQRELQKQHMQQLDATWNRGSQMRKLTVQQHPEQQQQQISQKFLGPYNQFENQNEVAPPAMNRLTTQVSDWLTTFWPVGKGKDQSKSVDDSAALEPRPLPPSRDTARLPVTAAAAASLPSALSDDAEIPPALEAGISSSIFKLVSSPSAMLSSLKSGVSSYFDFSSGRASFLHPTSAPITNGGGVGGTEMGNRNTAGQRSYMPVVMGTTSKRSSSLLDDYEESPMESRLRSVSSR